MSAHVSMVSLGVKDLQRSKAFYEALGWRNTTATQPTIIFLQGHNLVLGLYGREPLAKDAGVSPDGEGFRGIAFCVNLKDEGAVDAFHARAMEAGAAAVKMPQKVFWGGYSGYLSDPDGHLWEVAHNPFAPLDETGAMRLETFS
ncbi:MAG: VOC family protein [Pseudomonadota bacterium]